MDSEMALAVVDDFSPAAAEDTSEGFTIYFREPAARDRAAAAVARAFPDARITRREIDDNDWARRSQQHLIPVTVGVLTVLPDSRYRSSPSTELVKPNALRPEPSALGPSSLRLVIAPSMGFGTGHHATTRLCLASLQAIGLSGASVLDVGTGSGILAIAARMLGARSALGIDNDPDAIQAARANLELNPGISEVTFQLSDLGEALDVRSGGNRTFDVITANLTGALLVREAARLAGALSSRGRLIVSGLLDSEREAVVAAYAEADVVWEAREDEWVGLAFHPTF